MADVVVTPANVQTSSRAVLNYNLIAGATITAGQPVYVDPDDNNAVKPVDNDASATAANVVGIAVNGAADGQPVTICTRDPDFTPGFTSTVGAVACTSSTAGGITVTPADNTTGKRVSVLGVMTATNKMNLNIAANTAAIA